MTERILLDIRSRKSITKKMKTGRILQILYFMDCRFSMEQIEVYEGEKDLKVIKEKLASGKVFDL